MQNNNISKGQILHEQRNISRYTGLLYGRIFLLPCLFLFIVPLGPVPAYLFAFLLLAPVLLCSLLENKENAEPVLLDSCAKKYRYTAVRLSVEQHTGRIAVLLLAAWQFYIPSSLAVYLHLAPAALLMLYLIWRIISTAITRHNIHSYYMELRSLEHV
ncbi:hypothetical protein D7V86_00260 [bacterium D16-51]|nr:hypothetical protein D7V96_05025 [bacterium D16-59]RKI62676.1 hypothetical protein D7V86_00260 [bacterium D16-51]